MEDIQLDPIEIVSFTSKIKKRFKTPDFLWDFRIFAVGVTSGLLAAILLGVVILSIQRCPSDASKRTSVNYDSIIDYGTQTKEK